MSDLAIVTYSTIGAVIFIVGSWIAVGISMGVF